MTNQYLWVGITIGVFIAGLGIGYAINQYTVTPNMMAQNMQPMMSNPQAMQQMHDMMMNNPQHMQTMMNTMGPTIMNNMMNNPQMNQQMLGMMMQNQQFMHRMMTNSQFQQNWMGPWMSNSTNWKDMMSSGWMNQGMMGNNMISSGMMGTPITKESDVLKIISKIENLLDQVSSEYKKDETKDAYSIATDAYLENYEYVEGKIASKDRALMEKIELMLRVDLRNLIKNGSTQIDVDSKIGLIKDDLEKVKSLFN